MSSHMLNIKTDSKLQMFYVNVEGGSAYIKYAQPQDNVLDIKETFVPEPSRDKGVATELVSFAMDYAKSKNYKVTPTCPFVQSFVDDNPRYKDMTNKIKKK